ncbi:MAG TPA: DUF6364 family protein [Cyclobacteriaceae bacterium]|nr:DUF6364 family protein [Cyclobacteriaceae bacterium]
MEAKVTLKLNKRTLDKARRYARKHNTELSRIVEKYLENITTDTENDISPLVKMLSGISRTKSVDTKLAYTQYLKRKYS